jgi:hypothetical protein
VNTLLEITELWLHHPALGDTPQQVAAWYEAKAALNEHLAHTHELDPNIARRYATAAHQHAAELLTFESNPT